MALCIARGNKREPFGENSGFGLHLADSQYGLRHPKTECSPPFRRSNLVLRSGNRKLSILVCCFGSGVADGDSQYRIIVTR